LFADWLHNGDGLVDIDPGRGRHAGGRLFDTFPPLGATVQFIRVKALEHVDHPLVDRSIAIAHIEERRDALLVEIVGHGSAGPVGAFGLRVRRQVAEALVAVGIDPTCERIEPAGQRPVGVDAAALLIEEDAGAVILGLHAQDRAAGFGMLFDEFRRRHAETTREPKDFVRADADRLVVTAAGARIALVGKSPIARKRKINVGKCVLVRHSGGSGRARRPGSALD